MPQTAQRRITRHKLPIILGSEGNKTMKLDQLIEYSMRNIFPENPYTKYGGEATPRPFYKKLELSIFLDQQPEML